MHRKISASEFNLPGCFIIILFGVLYIYLSTLILTEWLPDHLAIQKKNYLEVKNINILPGHELKYLTKQNRPVNTNFIPLETYKKFYSSLSTNCNFYTVTGPVKTIQDNTKNIHITYYSCSGDHAFRAIQRVTPVLKKNKYTYSSFSKYSYDPQKKTITFQMKHLENDHYIFIRSTVLVLLLIIGSFTCSFIWIFGKKISLSRYPYKAARNKRV